MSKFFYYVNEISSELKTIVVSEEDRKKLLESCITDKLNISLDNYKKKVDINIEYLKYRDQDKVKKYLGLVR